MKLIGGEKAEGARHRDTLKMRSQCQQLLRQFNEECVKRLNINSVIPQQKGLNEYPWTVECKIAGPGLCHSFPEEVSRMEHFTLCALSMTNNTVSCPIGSPDFTGPYTLIFKMDSRLLIINLMRRLLSVI